MKETSSDYCYDQRAETGIAVNEKAKGQEGSSPLEGARNMTPWSSRRMILGAAATVFGVLAVLGVATVFGLAISRSRGGTSASAIGPTSPVGTPIDETVQNPVTSPPVSSPSPTATINDGGDVGAGENVDCVDSETADTRWGAVAGGGGLTSGPMVGHFTPNSAMIWAYAGNATVSVMYQRLDEDCPSLPVTVEMETNQNTIQLTGLSANTPYRYHVLVDGTKAGEMGSFRTAPEDPKQFRYMFGSCISFDEGCYADHL